MKTSELIGKPLVRRIGNIAYGVVISLAALWALRYIILFTAFDTFHTPTSSMTPTLQPDYTGLVSKLKLGGRLFNFRAAAEGRHFSVKRLPGYGALRKNDIIVFNAPWTAGWDSIAMNMRLYYCKRVVAVAGDTIEAHDGHYKVRGYDGVLGVPSEQDAVKDYVAYMRRITPDSVRMEGGVYAAPLDSLFNWTIDEFGPLVVPAKGMTIGLDRRNIMIYRKYIEWETGTSLPLDSRCLPLNPDSVTIPSSYTFRENYCFAAGDHAADSQDSRYWGFLPEKFIVGTVLTPPKGSPSAFIADIMIRFLRL